MKVTLEKSSSDEIIFSAKSVEEIDKILACLNLSSFSLWEKVEENMYTLYKNFYILYYETDKKYILSLPLNFE